MDSDAGVPGPCHGGRLGAVVRARRLQVGSTQSQLAAAAGVSVGAIRDLEQGATRRPHPLTLERLGAALGTDLTAGPPIPGPPIPGPASVGSPGSASRPARHLYLQVLGPLCAWLGSVPVGLGSFRQQLTLGLLAVYAGAVVSRDVISEALWGENPPPTATVMIQSCISRLRRALEPGRRPRDRPGLLVPADSGYRLRVGDDALHLDLARFDALSSQGRTALRAGQPSTACQLFDEALSAWHGEPLAGLDLLQTHPAVAGLAQRRAALIADYAEAASSQGWHDLVLPHLRTLTGQDILNERAHASLMIALAGTGQQAAALAVYDQITRRLDRQLGLRPGPELAASHARVLRQEIVPATRQQAATPAAAPGRAPAPAQRQICQPLPATTSAPASPLLRPCQLPPAVADFTGRADAVASLTHILGRTQTRPASSGVPTALVAGMPGAGKTALALTVAHQARAWFPDGQLWAELQVPGQSPADPGEVLGGFLRALGVPPGALPATTSERAALYRTLLADRRVLVVADDAASAAQVQPLLPGTAGSAALITSRTALATPGGIQIIPIETLDSHEALQMLSRIAGPQRVTAEPAAAARLASACGYLPLAIQIAGTRLAARPSWPLSVLADRVSRSPLSELTAGDLSVRARFGRTYQALSEPAQRTFRLLAQRRPDTAAGQASAAPPGSADATAAVNELADAYLLSPAGTDPAGEPHYQMHDLLRSYARELPATGSTRHSRHHTPQRPLERSPAPTLTCPAARRAARSPR